MCPREIINMIYAYIFIVLQINKTHRSQLLTKSFRTSHFGFLSWCYLPCICNSLELAPVIFHGICYILHAHCAFCMVFAAFGHGRLPFCMVFATSHLHGICFILILQSFMSVSWGFFRLSCKVSSGFHLGLHLGHLGFPLGVSLRSHLKFHLGFL